MKPWRCDPYLWVHLAGLATVPLWLDVSLLGLAVGYPSMPRLELGFIVALGVLPVLVMQLWRPFYIFSLPGLALRPTALTEDQRRLLTQFRRWRVRLGALLVPLPLVWVLVKLYPLAFLAREITPFAAWGRLGGVAIAALGFLMANLFLQVPAAVLQVMATPDRRMRGVMLYPAEQIASAFTLLGLPVGRLLPTIQLESETFPEKLDLTETSGEPRATGDRIATLLGRVEQHGSEAILAPAESGLFSHGDHAGDETNALSRPEIEVGTAEHGMNHQTHQLTPLEVEPLDVEIDAENDSTATLDWSHPEVRDSALVERLTAEAAIALSTLSNPAEEPEPTTLPAIPVDAFAPDK